jgi:hypothetical protein
MTQDQKIIRAKVGLLELKGAGLTNWSLRKPVVSLCKGTRYSRRAPTTTSI